MPMQALKRIISMMLVCAMVFSMLPMGALAEAVTDAAEVVTEVVTPEPTKEPTPEPTKEPTPEPTEEPTPEPTEEPTPEPTEEPTPEPTEEPTPEPTEEPTPEPTAEPTAEPTEEPTPEPTEEPIETPADTEAVSAIKTELAKYEEKYYLLDEEGNLITEPAEQVAGMSVDTLEAFVEDLDKLEEKINKLSGEEAASVMAVYANVWEYILDMKAAAEAILEADQEEVPTEPQEPEVTPDEVEPEATPDEVEPEATPDEVEPEATPDEVEPEATPDEVEPEATPDEVEPEATPDEVEPEATPDEVEPEATPDEASPDEATPDEATPDEAVLSAEAIAENIAVLFGQYAKEYDTETYDAMLAETVAAMDEAAMNQYLADWAALNESLMLLDEVAVAELKEMYAAELAWLGAIAAQVEAVMAAEAAMLAVRNQLDALNVPEYTAETLWSALDELIAAKQAEEMLDAYLAEIAAAQDALAALNEVDKAALETEYAVQLSFAKLLSVKIILDKMAADYYVEFEKELWILFETRVAIEDPAVLLAAYEDTCAFKALYETLNEFEKFTVDARYSDVIAFMIQYAAAIEAKLGQPMLMAMQRSWLDTSVSNDYYKVISENHYNLIPGAQEAEIVLNNAEGTDRKVVHVIEVNTKNPNVSIVPGYMGLDPNNPFASLERENHKTAGVSKMAKYYENTLGYNVVGGMNTSLAYDSNAPYTFMVYNGVVLQDPFSDNPLLKQHSGTAQTYLAVYEDGTCELRSASTPLNGNEWQVVSANFGWTVKNGELVSKSVERTSSDAARSLIGIKADGTLVLCMVDGRNANNSTGLSNYELGEMMLSLGCVNAVNCDGGGSSSFITKREGEKNFDIRCVPCDGAERDTIHSIFVVSNVKGPSNVFDHANITSEYKYYGPYTTSEFAAQAIDTNGFEMAVSEEAVWALSDPEFGTIENGVFTSTGKTGEVDVQLLYGGVVVGSKTIEVVIPKVARFANAETASPYGKTITLDLVVRAEVIAADQETNYAGDYDVYYQGDNFELALDNPAAGTLNGLQFTATTDEAISGVNVTMAYKYADLGTSTVKVNIGKETEVKWDFEDGDVSDFLGISALRKWADAKGIEPLIFSDGNFSDNTDSRTFLANRENGQVHNGSYALGVEIDYNTGDYASWTYNMFFNVNEEPAVLRDTANGQNATVLGAWVYIPEGAPGLAMQIQCVAGTSAENASGTGAHFYFQTPTGAKKNLNSMTEDDVPDSRWMYGTVDLTALGNYVALYDPNVNKQRSPSFIRFYIKPTVANNLVFYYDDISLDYSSVVPDRDKPVISEACYVPQDTPIELEQDMVITAKSAGFSAKIADVVNNYTAGLKLDTAKIYLDGIELESEVNASYLSTIENAVLDNGSHTVTFEVADKANNYTQLNVEFTVGEGNALVYVNGHNDKNNVPEADSVYYVDIKTDKVEDVYEVEANIKLNGANTWELEHMIVAPGFEVVACEVISNERDFVGLATSTDIHSVDNVANVLLRKTDESLTGPCTLVSLPLRVWSWDGKNSVTGEVITPEQQFATGYCPIVTIDYDVLFGYVETVNGEVLTFNGGASVATMINDDINPWHKHTLTSLEDVMATCTENGYTGRSYCDECGSVVEWGTVVESTGHSYGVTGELLVCENCGEGLNETGVVTVGEDKYYLLAGKVMTGWQSFGTEGYCYADPITCKVYANCEFKVNGLTYTANEEGLMLEGAWHEDFFGRRFSYGPGYYSRVWMKIGDAEYYFAEKTGYAYTGYQTITDNRNDPKAPLRWYHFAEDGKLIERMKNTGVVDTGNGLYYMEEGVAIYAGLVKVGDDYYCVNDKYGTVLTGRQWVGSYLVGISKNPLPTGYYEFGADGKMLNGVVEKENGTYYYRQGQLYDAGWVKQGNDYYVFTNGGKALVGRQWVGTYLTEHSQNPYKAGTFIFDKTGKLANGIVHLADVSYYCENGVPKGKGLVKANGTYYYANEDGSLAEGRIWVGTYPSNGLLPKGYYEFGQDGSLLNGVVEKHDGVYYFEQGQPVDTGWLKVGNDYYVFTNGGKALVGKHWVGTYLTQTSVNPFKVGTFVFGEDGKMENGVVTLADGLYYYKDGATKRLGLVKDEDKYYFVGDNGKLETGRIWVGTYDSHGLIAKGNYEFSTTTGEMLDGVVQKADGLYYYDNGVAVYKGLIERNGEYYYVNDGGKVETGRVYVGTYASNGIVKNGYYEFGADGAMLNGFEQTENGLYYYTLGRAMYYGVKVIDSNLYYISEGGKVETGRVWVGTYASNGLIPAAYYTFDVDGKLIK